MTLLLGLNHVIISQVYRIHIKIVFHEFFKLPTIVEIESKQYARANMFGIINALGALQDSWLKHDYPIRVPLPSVYPVKLHRKGSNKSPPNFPGRCVIALGWHIDEFFPPSFPLNIVCNSAIQMVSWILVQPILVYPK